MCIGRLHHIKACLFSVFLGPLSVASLVHLCWCLLTALSETWDVYSSTARKAAQGGCFSMRAKITNCLRDMRTLPSSLFSFNMSALPFCISQGPLCAHIGLSGTICVVLKRSFILKFYLRFYINYSSSLKLCINSAVALVVYLLK